MALLLAIVVPRPGWAAQVQYRADVPASGPTHVTYLRDEQGTLTLPQVLAASSHFLPDHARTVHFGFSSAAYWLHLSLQSHVNAPTTVYLSIPQPTLDDVRLYVLQHGELQQSVGAGDALPFTQHPVSATHPVLPLRLQPDARYELYLRVATHRGALLVPLVFESAADFEHDTRVTLLLNGLFCGIFGALLIYNLFLYAALRHRAYAYYVALVPCAYLALTALNGFGPWMLYPGLTWLSHEGLVVTASCGVACVLLFARALLQTESIRWLDRLLRGTAALAACNALSALGLGIVPPIWNYRCLYVLTCVAPGAGALAGVLALRQGHPQARFFLLAQLAGWLAMISYALMVVGLVPFSQTIRMGLLFAASAQVLLISLALADRIRALQLAAYRAESTTRQVLASRELELERGVEERTRELDEARRRAEYLATVDALTGVYNRRGLMPLIQQAVARALRHAAPLSLISFDLDGFKEINDEFGHAEGDRVLCQLVALTRQLVRATDLFGRIGGEEFMLMVNAPREQALLLAERLRAHLEANLSAGTVRRGVTASFGVVSLGRRLTTLEALQLAVDAALYRAKNHGRNRVESYDATNDTTRTRAIMSNAPWPLPAPMPAAAEDGG